MSKAEAEERFIIKAQNKHKNKYDYSKVKYNTCKQKVCIICPEHGEFWQTPDNHLQGRGCPVCRYISSGKKNSWTKDIFILKAREVHGWKYDYSKVEYINNTTPVCIICPEHGEFWQIPSVHIYNKAGCPRCSRNHKYTTVEFIETLPNWITEKYDFSKFEYKRTHDKSILICPEHGEFLISPHNIRAGIGCPSCSESKLERTVRLFLKDNSITYISEYKQDADFHKQTIDFYLPDYNIGIECQGEQHFKPTDFGGKGDTWAKMQYQHIINLDIEKQKLCKDKGINLIYYVSPKNLELLTANPHFIGYEFYVDTEEIKTKLMKNK